MSNATDSPCLGCNDHAMSEFVLGALHTFDDEGRAPPGSPADRYKQYSDGLLVAASCAWCRPTDGSVQVLGSVHSSPSALSLDCCLYWHSVSFGGATRAALPLDSFSQVSQPTRPTLLEKKACLAGYGPR